MRSVRLAIEGCGHGTLHAIYASVQKACESKQWPGVDLLIIGGDFQAVRNSQDLNCMAVPVKFRELGDFHEYYSGKRTAPFTTVFVGGNHEASNYLFELFYGGWVAPNIYYIGAANVLRLGPLRIAGLSGIWKGYNFRKPHYERLPYNNDDVRSAYHVREIDTRKLLQIRTQVDIGLSHDWPNGIEWQGDYRWLFKKKDLFEADAKAGKLGSIAAKQVLERLRPPYWFSAHLHIKYTATVRHPSGPQSVAPSSQFPLIDVPHANLIGQANNDDEIDLDLDEANTEPALAPEPPGLVSNSDESTLDIDQSPTTELRPSAGGTSVSRDLRNQLPASFAKPISPADAPEPSSEITNTTTKFLALDKCLQHRDFLQLLEVSPPQTASTIPDDDVYKLSYDPEWLAITRVFASHIIVGDDKFHTPPDAGRAHYRSLIEEQERWVDQNITTKDKLIIPHNFVKSAPIEDEMPGSFSTHEMPREYSNPQTRSYCDLLKIPNVFEMSDEEANQRKDAGPKPGQDRGDFRHGRVARGGGRGSRGRGQRRGNGRRPYRGRG